MTTDQKQWGLTGGIASGKSTVAARFVHHGVSVCDMDQLGHRIIESDPKVQQSIAVLFGESAGDRVKMRKRLFEDGQLRKKMEALIHPPVLAAYQEWRRKQSGPLVICEAALLVETDFYREMDGLIVVHADATVRRQRLMERDAISPELADQMIASQATDAQRTEAATIVIHNEGTKEELQKKADSVIRTLTQPQ